MIQFFLSLLFFGYALSHLVSLLKLVCLYNVNAQQIIVRSFPMVMYTVLGIKTVRWAGLSYFKKSVLAGVGLSLFLNSLVFLLIVQFRQGILAEWLRWLPWLLSPLELWYQSKVIVMTPDQQMTTWNISDYMVMFPALQFLYSAILGILIGWLLKPFVKEK